VRGIRWSNGTDRILLLHEAGADIDTWGTLPATLANDLTLDVSAIDLPGHGLSDGPWEPARAPDLIRSLMLPQPADQRQFVVAAGETGSVTLELAAALGLSGLACLTPQALPGALPPARSPKTPKLFLAGSLAGADLNTARRLASTCGGWTAVISVPVAERGTGLLASAWRDRLIEQIVGFLRDCQRPFPHLRNHNVAAVPAAPEPG
jgi:pimeloyl-ACP methyl ester carboxylesterase